MQHGMDLAAKIEVTNGEDLDMKKISQSALAVLAAAGCFGSRMPA
jgi:hypothetical protein